MEIDEDDNNIEEYIENSVYDFVREKKIEFYTIFSEKKVLISLINALKEKYHFKYVEIMNFFGISKAAMEYLKV